MKKRAMKKYIPKNTSYCYKRDKNGKVKSCKYWRKVSNKEEQDNGYCIYLKFGDWQGEGISLLWDSVKECGISEE